MLRIQTHVTVNSHVVQPNVSRQHAVYDAKHQLASTMSQMETSSTTCSKLTASVRSRFTTVSSSSMRPRCKTREKVRVTCKCVIVHKPKSGLKPKRFRSKSFVLDSCHIPRNRSRHSTQSSRIDSPTPTTHPGSHPPPLPFLAVAKVRAVQVILSDVERDVRVVGQHGARLVDRAQFPATASCPPSGGLETTEQTIT